MKNPLFDTVVWGSLRLTPISDLVASFQQLMRIVYIYFFLSGINIRGLKRTEKYKKVRTCKQNSRVF